MALGKVVNFTARWPTFDHFSWKPGTSLIPPLVLLIEGSTASYIGLLKSLDLADASRPLNSESIGSCK